MSAHTPTALRLLIIDDEALQLNAICELLRHEGHDVVGYTDPLLALAEVNPGRFDLALVDMSMPSMNGIALVERFKEIVPDLGCLVITADATISKTVEAMRAGALDFIPKPFDLSTLLPALHRAWQFSLLLAERTKSDAEARKNSAALSEANRRLRQAQDESLRANEAKSYFVSSLSHELRTPLTSIIGFAHILQSGDFATTKMQRTQFANNILKSAKHLLALVNDVLDLSQIEAGKLTIRLETVPVQALMDECVEMLLPVAAAHDVSLIAVAAPNVTVIADRTRLKQILLVLLSNAIKYNRSGGEITLTANPAGTARVALAISDTGIGMTPEQLTRLFEPFERLGQEKGRTDGYGLGLAIARQLALLMHSDIEVSSSSEQGTRFSLALPSTTA